MDELQSVRDFAGPAALASPADLAPGRERLIAAIDSGPHRARPPRRPRRLGWAGVAAAGLAAAITGVLALAPGEVLAPPAAHADPVLVLREAAAAMRREPAVDPRPDQFVYTRTQQGQGVREVWLSVDGTRDGSIKNPGSPAVPSPGCRDGKRGVLKGDQPVPGVLEDCEPDPAFRTDLPETPEAVLDWLRRNAGEAKDDANALAKDAVYLLGEEYARPAARAALLEALTRVPGLEAVPGAEDAAGRSGIGITWDRAGTTFVFDEQSHVLLGSKGEAVLSRGVVDQVGDLPE